MRMTRIYQNCTLNIGEVIQLDSEASNHLINVLRLQAQAPLIVFNGLGGEFSAIISEIKKKNVLVHIENFYPIERESFLKIHLAQVVSRGEKMDLTIQKAVELGVHEITPIISERCEIKLSQERWLKRILHWQKIIISACEQCGRNTIPQLNSIMQFADYISQKSTAIRLILHHRATSSLSVLEHESLKNVDLLIGPEGGFTENEIAESESYHFTGIKLGPRILRTETAGIAVIAALQTKFGDFL